MVCSALSEMDSLHRYLLSLLAKKVQQKGGLALWPSTVSQHIPG